MSDIIMRHDGSADALRFQATYDCIVRREKENRRKCVAELRDRFAAAIITPDDGWVNRKENTVCPPDYATYAPREAAVGEIIALGSETSDANGVAGSYRICRVTGMKRGLLSGALTYSFEPVSTHTVYC